MFKILYKRDRYYKRFDITINWKNKHKIEFVISNPEMVYSVRIQSIGKCGNKLCMQIVRIKKCDVREPIFWG